MTTQLPTHIPSSLLPMGSDDVNLLPPQAAATLQELRNTLATRSQDHLGYPYNFGHGNFLGPLQDFLRFSINNVGDPFAQPATPSSNGAEDVLSRRAYHIDTSRFETEIVDIYAQQWGLKPGEYTGLVSHSGTEGNRLCVDVANHRFPDGIVYFSNKTHYSVPGSATSFRLATRCIPCYGSGEINYELLEEALAEGKKIGKPAIVVMNIGTTMTGACDDLGVTLRVLKKVGYDLDNEVYIHLDGALSGLMLPFLDEAAQNAFVEHNDASTKRVIPSFDAHPCVGSFSCSGHKFLGCPMPAGICVFRKTFAENMNIHIDYLNAQVNGLAMGSRNGHTAVFLWHELQRKGRVGLMNDVRLSIENAEYLKSLLTARRIACFRNPVSNTVVFENPQDRVFVKKYHLACQEEVAHVVVMPHVTREKLEEFAAALAVTHAPGGTHKVKHCLVRVLGRINNTVCFCGDCPEADENSVCTPCTP